MWDNVGIPEGILNVLAYTVILLVHLAGDRYFHEDNAPYQTVGTVLIWFKEHGRKFTLLNWPARSSDLNPNENMG
ncbi:hypothetical protein TNCV_383061 [Trichonephila clavipes]|nr:hypothetical protein TNCV_383061 [Trichonephila clavipes]